MKIILLQIVLLSTSVHAFAPRPSPLLPMTASRLYFKDVKDDTPVTEPKELLHVPKTLPGDLAESTTTVSMEQLTKLRPYPLFVAEKIAGVVDGAIHGLTKLSSGDSNNDNKLTKTKEHVVVLGSGWGAASFISELDPDLYDITVISPRNHFIFTPMLAGASVGSVEYRSICEPIREVCAWEQQNYIP